MRWGSRPARSAAASIRARTAARFAQLCELAAAGGAVAHVDSATGRVHLTFPDLAARAA